MLHTEYGAFEHAGRLHTPTGDAAEVGSALKRLGISVIRLADADGATLETDLPEFREKAANAEVAVVYCSGHGTRLGAERTGHCRLRSVAGGSRQPTVARARPRSARLAKRSRRCSYGELPICRLPPNTPLRSYWPMVRSKYPATSSALGP